MDSAAASILERRKNKAIAIVLGVKEREIDSRLPRDLQEKMRKVVLDQFNEYHETVMDVFRSVSEASPGVVLNEHYLELLTELHSAVMKDGN